MERNRPITKFAIIFSSGRLLRIEKLYLGKRNLVESHMTKKCNESTTTRGWLVSGLHVDMSINDFLLFVYWPN